MNRTCFIEGCTISPCAYCQCEEPFVYFCNTHFLIHQQIGGVYHSTVTLIRNLRLADFNSICDKIRILLQEFEENKIKVQLIGQKIIEKIQEIILNKVKRFENLRQDLELFMNYEKSGQFVKVNFELQESVYHVLDNKEYEIIEAFKIFKDLEKIFEGKPNKKGSKLGNVLNKELCKECKIDYYIKCEFHKFCGTCKLCFCKDCLKSTTYPIDDQKKQKLEIEQKPSLVISNPTFSIETSIFKAFNKSSNSPICITKLSSKNSQILQSNYNIYKFLSKKLPCFLTISGSASKQNEILIISELAVTPLSNLTHEHFESNQVLKISKKLIEGFAFMSLYRIYHRNISLSSILLTEDLTPKIIDFTSAVLHTNDLSSNVISFETLAQPYNCLPSPERRSFVESFRNKGKVEVYNIEKSDVFSLGAVLLQLFMRFKVVLGISLLDSEEEVRNLIRRVENKDIRKVVRKMMRFDPKDRPYFRQVLEEFQIVLVNNNAN